jgi:ADP-ribose pyrophosphatase YjhB (NUDIX family)
MSDSHNPEAPRWTLPPRKEISPQNLHISSFVVVNRTPRKGTGPSKREVLLLRAGDKHPLSFRRGKLVLPATILTFGEQPKAAARRALADQLGATAGLGELEFLELQSYLGAHWDMVVLFQAKLEAPEAVVRPNPPFTSASFYDLGSLPRSEIAEDHLEVLDSMLNPSTGAKV